jgi:hypothetical protein
MNALQRYEPEDGLIPGVLGCLRIGEPLLDGSTDRIDLGLRLGGDRRLSRGLRAE